MPPDLGEASKPVWCDVLREFGHTEVIRGADAQVLRLYCDAVARYREAQLLYEKVGPLIREKEHGGQLVKNPLHQIVRDNATLVRSLAAELGLTPAARASIPSSPKSNDDGMAALLTPKRRSG